MELEILWILQGYENLDRDPTPFRSNNPANQQPGEPQPGSAPPQMPCLVKCDSHCVLECAVLQVLTN
jgi:hypothetical protein